ncbi:MAG: SOS response-associated peptidase [Cyanobacteria bacterium J06598_3]
MCGRYTQTRSGAAIAQTFSLASVPEAPARYNIAPTQAVGAIAQIEHQREFKVFQWGLIPSWSKDPSISARMFNARSETVAEKPSFRAPFKRRRCLIVADGFYEWRREGKQKQPYYIQVLASSEAGNQPNLFGFAGLWEKWEGGDGSYLETCTILTTEPNELMAPIHNRMPVIIHPEDYDLWLDPYLQEGQHVQHLLRPYEPDAMHRYPVSKTVNNARNEVPECIEPIELEER